ncbi:GNAT family N-acetyltransferase family protein [Terrabacter terrigena]|uniref:GCN5 family acetyltransferase n=1 Tax=Terrabacter terrigena TaxID=574718 RepID=A0ABW3MWW4_9MICO
MKVPTDVGAMGVTQATALAESAEAEFMYAFETGAPPSARSALGMTAVRLGGGVVLAMGADPTGGYWNKALGFGVTEPVTDALVRAVLEVYRASGSAVAVLQLAPAALPEDWDDICGRHGIVGGTVWAKLLRSAGPEIRPTTTELRVGRIGPGDVDDWSRVYCAGFEMPEDPDLVAFFGSGTDEARGFHSFGAWSGDRLVAAANLHVSGTVAAFCGAATLPGERRRGAQSAFMAARLAEATRLGCEWMSAETWQEFDGHVNPSLHNMERAGFVQVYDRRNWVWREEHV